MTDYIEEQQNELEALESIYPEEFEAISEKEFRITIQPDEEDEETACTVALHVKYTPKYPDELPEYNVEVLDGDLPESYLERIDLALKEAGEDSLGMAMIFTLASIIKEELNQIVLDAQRVRDEVEEERKRKEEEIEQAKFRGTKLTIERFAEWKAKFDKEMESKEDKEKIARMKELKNRLNGRQLFEQDKSLALSDAKYMDEGDVSVDVSQFEKEERSHSEDEDDTNAVWRQFGKED
ncbi:ubiquitin-conjugating enzyme/RWD-like protein [Phycomyces nitens]|nr:ubiquitin-conjugating enzyme/RWD-like protein [Phycomyces nitens]